MRKETTKPEPINHIGRIQRAIVKDSIKGGKDDIDQLCASLNLDHCKHRSDFKYTQKDIIPYLVKIVRKKYKWHEKISSMPSYSKWVKTYKLNTIRNYRDIADKIKDGPSIIPIKLTEAEKKLLKEKEGK